MDFSHLHLHTTYSILDGYGTPEQVIKRVKELGQKSFAITDHGNVGGLLPFYLKAKAEGVKVILGCEFYFVDDVAQKEGGKGYEVGQRHHLIVLAKNYEGYKNLLRLSTSSNVDGFYRKPRIDYALLEKFSDGLVVLSACLAGKLPRLILNNKKSEARSEIERMRDIFGDDYYLEIQPNELDEQKFVNEKLLRLSSAVGVGVVATNDCHYIKKEDAYIQEIMLAINTRDRMANLNRFKFDIDGLYIRARVEMEAQFSLNHSKLSRGEVGMALDMTQEIAGRCNVEIPLGVDYIPEYVFPDGFNSSYSYLKFLCNEGISRKFKGCFSNEYSERLKKELKAIKSKNFINYFLIVQDFINWAKDRDILVGHGRGSSAGSLVSYLLNITEVDPIRHGLLFERFIDPNRFDMPDIDMDFEDEQRGRVKEYISKKYGDECVANIGTYGTEKGKAALKDVARVFDVPVSEVQPVCDSIIERSSADARKSLTIEDSAKEFRVVKEFADKYPDIIKYAGALEGQIRQTGIHAAGVIISKTRLDELCSSEIRKGQRVASLDGLSAKDIGLLKFDILGLKTLSVLKKVASAVGMSNSDLYNIDISDTKPLSLLKENKMQGVFQLETLHSKRICADVGAKTFDDIVNINACTRPGTIQSGALDIYVRIKKGIGERESFGDKKIDAYYEYLTKDTCVIIFQEQVMRAGIDVGGFTWKETSYIRGAMSKSKGQEYFNKYEGIFIKNAVAKGYLEAAARKFWNNLCTFGAWGFNKCIAGNTEVRLGATWGSSGKTTATIEELYDRYEANPTSWTRCRKPLLQSLFPDGRIRPHRVKAIYKNGIKLVRKYSFSNGVDITCTPDHKFLIDGRWLPIKQAKIGSSFLSSGAYEHTVRINGSGHGHAKGKKYLKIQKGFPSGKGNPSWVNGKTPAYKNFADVNAGKPCGCCGEKHHRMEIHHGDFSKGYPVEIVSLIGVGKLHSKMTYDIEMEQHHNYVIDGGIISHNSHSVSYSYLTYLCLYFKYYYPIEFYSVAMSMESDDDKKFGYIKEARGGVVKIYPPLLNKSKKDFSKYKKGIIVGFSHIKGVGEKAAVELESKAPFNDIDGFLGSVNRRIVNKRVISSLFKAGAMRRIAKAGPFLSDGDFIPVCSKEEIRREKHLSVESRVEVMPFFLGNIPFSKIIEGKIESFISQDEILWELPDSDEWKDKFIIGVLDSINLRSKVRGRKVAKGGKEQQALDDKASDIVQFCIFGINSDNFVKTAVLSPDILYWFKDYLNDWQAKKKIIAFFTSKTGKAKIVSCHSMIDVSGQYDGRGKLSPLHYLILSRSEILKKCKGGIFYLYGVNEFEDRKGSMMAFLRLYDGKKSWDAVMFSKQYSEFKEKMKIGNYLRLQICNNIVNGVKKVGSYLAPKI